MNWGQKIVAGGVLFMLFITGMSVVMIMRNEDDELIEADYYQKGLDYNADYQQQKNALEDPNAPIISTDTADLKIAFSSPVSYQLECKRPSDAKMDKNFSGQANSGQELKISRTDLAPGPWFIRLMYQRNAKLHLIKKEIVLP